MKIIVDICMAVFLIFSFIRWEGDPSFHLIVGTVCTLFFVIHVFIHRKWIKAVTKSYMAKKVKPELIGKYRVDMLLIAVWGICITTGFLSIGSFVGGIEWMAVFSRIHGVSARLGLVLTFVHIVQHRAQIMSYLKVRKKAGKLKQKKQIGKSKRIVRGVSHLALHVLLHVISIHLVVLFTFVHGFRHRREIMLRFRRRQPVVSHDFQVYAGQLAA